MADSNGKIYIIVTDKMPGGETPEKVKKPKKEKDEDELFEHWARNKLLSLAKETAMQQVNYALNNIGNFTGNYETQAQVNNVRIALGKIIGFATATAAGAPYGLPGMIISGATYAISSVISDANEVHLTQVSISKQRREVAILRERSGLNQYVDGSRGTQN